MTKRENELEKCLSEMLCWVYPWKKTRRSKEFIEEAMRGFRLVGRKHPFIKVERIEQRLDRSGKKAKP